MSRRRVVITGMGVISPIGNTLDEFWTSLVNGRTGVGPLTLFNVEKYSSKIAAQVKDFDPDRYIDPKESRRMDQFIMYALAAAKEAVDHSGLNFESVDPRRAGVVIGSGIGGLQTIEDQKEVLQEKGPRRVSPFLIPMLIVNMAAGYVSMRYGLRGPNTCVVTACATGTHSIGDAARLIQFGQADVILAGGSESALTPLGFAGFCSARALSTRNDEPERASRPFDKERDGFVMGEGAGVLVLEELEFAKKRGAQIFAEVVGYGMTADAFHVTMPHPEGLGACEAMSAALDDAQLDPSDVDYINAHGTSTELNDKTESQAIRKVFGESASKLAVNSTKSMTGHLLGAAGAVEAIACAKTLSTGVIHPTANYEFPDPDCDLDYVPKQAREANVRAAMSNSFGFGGHNAVLVLKKFE